MIGRFFAFAAVAFAALASHGARMASEPWVEHILAGATNRPMDAAYRLMSTDGETYQDATGVVWIASEETALSPWHVASITYSNGVTVATNALPGVPSWSIDGEWYGGDVGAEEWIWTLRVPAGGSEYSTVGGAENASPSDMSLSFALVSGDISGLSFSRTNTVSHFWSPVDHVLYASSGGGGGGLTTNDVCNIVTNETRFGEGEWRTSDSYGGYWKILDQWMPSVGTWQIWFTNVYTSAVTDGIVVTGDENAFALNVEVEGGNVPIVRDAEIRNALGLARLVDLPPLTNGLPDSISAVAQAAISTNNPAFVAAVTNCPVVIAAADGTTIGDFGDYGTLGALLAALAAAITWLKTNKADASSLPYALVDVTPTSGAPFVLAACFPIKYVTRDETEVTVTAENAQTLSISGGNVVHDGLTIFSCNSNGTFAGEAEVDSVTFGDPATPPTSSTQVLGFTPTYALADRAINAVSLTESATLVFPAQTTGKARDFVVRLTLTETSNVVPSVTFPSDVAYETEGGEWPDLTEAGTYIVRLTEVPTASESETARFFLQCSSAVADAEPPSAGGAA